MTKHEIISPLYDFAFAQIFGNQQNIGNTRAFLKTLLDIPEDDYGDLTVVDPNIRRFFQDDKMGVVDLKLSTKSGRIIHIELQVEKTANLRNRILYYAVRLSGDQLKWGDDYGQLHQVICILICDHVLLEGEKSYINRYELRNSENRTFTDLLKIVILELPKLPKEEDAGVWPWLQFFKCKKKEEYEMLAKKHPELKKAVSCVKKISLMERWRWTLFLMHTHRMDVKARKQQIQIDARAEGHAEGLAVGHAEGLEEGLAEGRSEEKLEIARKLKSKGLPLADIVDITGLSFETIEQM